MASSCFTIALTFLVASQIVPVDGNAFLKAKPVAREERMSEEDVQTSLLAEVEGTFGEGSASSRVKQIETQLATMYAALPKNEQGYLGHATVRYALHRLFVQRHGWSIKGLDAAGGHRNSTASAGLLKEQVPAYIQDLFEQRLGGRGFGLHELSVLAATVEHLVHSEAIKRLGDAFKIHRHLPTSLLSENQADEVLDTYMMAYILTEDLANMTLPDALQLKREMPELYMSWGETKEFVHATRRNTTESDSSADQKASGKLDFSLVARAAERVGERFGGFQDHECRQIKASLLKMEEKGTGRVPLAEFYKPAVDGHWQFGESVAYLRQLGALDESDAHRPRVIISNYISSPTNCIASSSFYSVCCIDECEGFMGHLERQIAAPEASAKRIAALVSELSSTKGSTQLSPSLLNRLDDIAAEHGGSVPLHGRLFAQWMHHAFPHECPYPHLSGTTNPQTADEWLESTGEETTASSQEMRMHIAKAGKAEKASCVDKHSDCAAWARKNECNKNPVYMKKNCAKSCGDCEADTLAAKGTQQDAADAALPWSHEEELLFTRLPQSGKQTGGTFSGLRNLVLLASVLSAAYGAFRSSKVASPSGKYGIEKQLV